jgi:hypothetical protein
VPTGRPACINFRRDRTDQVAVLSADAANDNAVHGIAVWVVAIGLFVAGSIHAFVFRHQLRAYVPYGLVFAVLAITQLLLAVAVVRRPVAQTLGYVALLSAWIVALWLVSRTTGLPIGPSPWQPAGYGVPEVVASCTELVTAAGCFLALWTTVERRPTADATELAGR